MVIFYAKDCFQNNLLVPEKYQYILRYAQRFNLDFVNTSVDKFSQLETM